MDTLVAAPVAEPTTPIKPSEALRLGRLTRPSRISGTYFAGATDACALGAIAVGLGYEPDPHGSDTRQLIEVGRLLENHGLHGDLRRGVVALNDGMHWGDDLIVAWLQERGL